MNWNSVPLKLFLRGNSRSWNPADIDLSQDAADWQALTDDERHVSAMLCAQFVAGEEAVTVDVLPFLHAVVSEGRFEDAMYLTQFAFEEAKHTEAFRRWLDAVGLDDDLHGLIEKNSGYQAIFCEALPAVLQGLLHDPSPAAQVRASITYNHVVEGMLALTGYHAWNLICRQRQILPGMQQIIAGIASDERRHMAWGTFTCRRHVAADEGHWSVAQAQLAELMEPALALVRYPFEELGYPPGSFPFGLDVDTFVSYALGRAARRLGAIEGVKGRAPIDIERDSSPIDMEEEFASEDDKASTSGPVM